MKKSIFALFMLLQLNELPSTEPAREVFAVHPKIGFGLPFHSSDFEYLNEQVSCGKFASGSGFSLFGGADFELPVSQNLLLDLGIYYKSMSGNFSIDRITYGYDIANQKPVTITAENKIETSMQFLSFQPGIKYKLAEELLSGPLFLNLGFGLNIPIGNNFTQQETIKSPENAVFIYDSKYVQSRDLFDGEISGVSGLIFSIKAGFENHLKLSENLAFTQSLGFEYNFNSFIDHSSWNAFEPTLALGLRYSFKEAKELPPPPVVIKKEVPAPKPEIVILPDPILELKFGNNPPENFVINTGNELVATQILLNTVFFETGSAEVPASYAREDKYLNYNKLSPIDAQQYNLLRIAKLVKSAKNAKVIVTGATSGIAIEHEGVELAKKRANAVADILVKLGVEPKQIDVKWNISPANPSNQEYTECIAENQRVDITLKNAALQEYVSKQKYGELEGEINYSLKMENLFDRSISAVHFPQLDTAVVASNGQNEYNLKFKAEIVDTKTTLPIFALIERMNIKKKDSFTLDLKQVKQNVVSLITKNFKAIIRFDYNSSVLSEDNKNLVRELLQVIPKDATIKILGSADALGSESSNSLLEQNRAENTANFIRSINGNINIKTGTNTNKFDDSTPVGRFLNRSIILTIE